MGYTVVTTDAAPRTSAPLSQAVRCGSFLFVSGQVPIDPRTGLVTGGGIREQVGQTLANLAAVLEAGGSSMDRVLKTTCFLTDMNDFPSFNDVYAAHFKATRPARSTCQVARLAGPFLVEIEAIAEADDG